MRRCVRHLIFLFSLSTVSCIPVTGLGQESPNSTPTAPEEASANRDGPSTTETLISISDNLSILERQISEKQNLLSQTSTESETESLQAEIAALVAKKAESRATFDAIAAGVNPAEFEAAGDEGFVLKNEVNDLLEPLVEELKEITARPREMEQLRSDLDYQKARSKTARTAIENISKQIVESRGNETVIANLQQSLEIWNDRKQQAENQTQVLTYRLEQLNQNNPSLIATFGNGFRAFFRSRARNLVFAIVAFIVVFFTLRYFHQKLHRFTPWKKPESRTFFVRLLDVSLYTLGTLGATAAALIVLYAAGDWVLLGIAIIVLIGIGLAAKNAFPQFYEQARILLNLGEVREGERVIYNGVPWKVERLSFFSNLINPALRGGRMRLPIRQISSLVSRPADKDEPFFPSQEGDWVELADTTSGRVILQTPDVVQIVQLGGARVTYSTADFYSQTPEILSGSFRITSTFGIDYKYQPICTTEVPGKMWAHLTQNLTSEIGDHELIKSLKVEFQSAGASSLDYAIIVDLDGSLASKKQMLLRSVQRHAVDCCNENGWEIPFTQITLHQANPCASLDETCNPQDEKSVAESEKPVIP